MRIHKIHSSINNEVHMLRYVVDNYVMPHDIDKLVRIIRTQRNDDEVIIHVQFLVDTHLECRDIEVTPDKIFTRPMTDTEVKSASLEVEAYARKVKRLDFSKSHISVENILIPKKVTK